MSILESRRRSRRGMTLMELVIALAITGMMATAGAAAFGSIIDHRKELKDATVSTERAAAMREMLRSWIYGGTIQFMQGGGPRGLNRAAQASTARSGSSSSSLGGMNAAAVTAAQAAGDEIGFVTQALNPSGIGNVRIRLYIDADANTPEKGLTIEYQPNLQMPLVRKMLDSTIDTLHVDFLDMRTNRWYPSSEAATITPRAMRLSLASGVAPMPPILGLPMIFIIGSQAQNSRVLSR